LPISRSKPLDGDASPRDAGGEDQALRPHALVAVEKDHPALGSTPSDGARHQDLGAERRACCSARLASSSPETAVRKAEVVLDPRRRARLAARRLALDDERAQAFRRAVHRGGEARRDRRR
jgi:hypothetical protein